MVKQKKNKYLGIKITKEMRDIIQGYIASDGNVSKTGILTIDQSIKQQKFVYWLYKHLSPICKQNENELDPANLGDIIKLVKRTDKRNGNVTYSKRFFTRSLCKGFYHMWYQSEMQVDTNGNSFISLKKKLPFNMSGFFSPTFLAVWFAGDGTKIVGSLGAKFEVTAFSPKERLKLKNLFWQKYQIDAKINRAGISRKGNPLWTLNINASDYPKFRTLITQIDLIETIFPHKLHPKT